MSVVPDPQDGKVSLMMVEFCLTLLAAVVAFGWPKLGDGVFTRVERAFGKLARRKGLSVAVVGLSALLLRLAILPVCPIPKPFVPDDFSFLLAADTFAHGRLTNPTPAMWIHFETIHVTMVPSYMSMYFPAHGLLLAAGKVLTGHAWFGALLASALMCAAICWMLQAWLPPAWALLGGFIAVIHLGLFTYWVNTYAGVGLLAAIGGALILGAWPRFRKTPELRYTMLMAVGAIILATTRPYEGVLLSLPVLFVLAKRLWSTRRQLSRPAFLRLTAAPLALLFAAGAWLGYYDYRAFGNPLTLPYTVDRNTYAVAPYFLWQSERPEPAYHHAALRRFYLNNEAPGYEMLHRSFVFETLLKVIRGLLYYAGIALLPPLLMFGRVIRDRRTRFLLLCVAVMCVGMLVQIFFIPHYVAPFTAAFYALGLQAMRHLRRMKADNRPMGLGWVRLSLAVCVVMVGVRLFAGPLHINNPEWPASHWNFNWYGPANFGEERMKIQSELEQRPGKQLVIVRYAPDHDAIDEWVYNAPDIDTSKVIWARDMDASSNRQLLDYYHDRQVWLVEPDRSPASVRRYPLSDLTHSANKAPENTSRQNGNAGG